MKTLILAFSLCSAAFGVDFVTGQTLSGTYRNDYGGKVGMRFHMFRSVTTTTLGKWCAAADTSTKSLYLIKQTPASLGVASGYSTVATVSIVCPGTAGKVQVASVNTLTAGEDYILAHKVDLGVNGFYQGDTAITTTEVARVRGPAYQTDGSTVWGQGLADDTTFSPVYFQYNAISAITAPVLQDKRGNVITSIDRYGALGMPPHPTQARVYVAGPTGCSITVTDSDAGSGFAGYVYENAEKGLGAYPTAMSAVPLPAIIRVHYTNDWYSWATLGNAPITLSFVMSGGGCSTTPVTLTLNTHVVAARKLPTITYRTSDGLVPSACTGSELSGPETCVYPDEPLNSLTPLAIRTSGATGTDAVWGNVMTRITGHNTGGCYKLHGYSAMTAFTRDSLNVWQENNGCGLGGSQDLVKISDMSTIRSGLDSQTLDSFPATIWDGEVRFQTGTANIVKLVFNPTTGAAVNSTTFDTNVSPWFIQNLWTGGTADMSSDGWAAFTDSVLNKVCLINLNGITIGNYTTKIYCNDYEPIMGSKRLDSVHATNRDVRTGKHYALLLGTGPTGHQASSIWQANEATGVLDFVIQPEYHSEASQNDNDGDGFFDDLDDERGMQDGHSDVVDFEGRQFWCAGNEEMTADGGGGKLWGACVDLTAGAHMFQPVEVGGGFYLINRLGDTSNQSDHTTCSMSGHICGFSYYNADGATVPLDRSISAATIAAPTVLTIASDPSWATGTRVVIAGITGPFVSCLEQRAFIITRTDATHISLDGSDCSAAGGAYSGSDGLVAEVRTNAKNYRTETILFDLDHIIRSINTRNYLFASIPSPSYSAYPMGSLSMDGTLLAFHSTLGFPSLQDYYTPTAWRAADIIVPVITPTATGAVIAFTTSAARTCALVVYDSVGTSQATATTLSSTYHHVVFDTLSAGADYTLRATCKMFSTTRKFKTLPSPSGTAVVSVLMKGIASSSTITLNWGTTTGLGSAGSAASCSSGAVCQAFATASKGLVYVQAVIKNGGGTTIATGPLTPVVN